MTIREFDPLPTPPLEEAMKKPRIKAYTHKQTAEVGKVDSMMVLLLPFANQQPNHGSFYGSLACTKGYCTVAFPHDRCRRSWSLLTLLHLRSRGTVEHNQCAPGLTPTRQKRIRVFVLAEGVIPPRWSGSTLCDPFASDSHEVWLTASTSVRCLPSLCDS